MVVVAGTSRPVANAPVSLEGPPSNRPDPIIPNVTDANGRFSFQNVAPPRGAYYRISANIPGFERALEEIPYKAGQNLKDVVVTVMTGGTIRGRITRENGTAAAGINVFVYHEHNNWTDPPRTLVPSMAAADGSGFLITLNRMGTDADLGQGPRVGGTLGTLGVVQTPTAATTDAAGNYVLRRIPPGKYLAGVEFPFGYTPNPDVFATTFYPGVTDSTKAKPVIIEPESDFAGIDFSVVKAARFTVSGTTENLNGLTSTVVSLHPVGERNMAPGFYASVNPDGRFQIQNVLAGSYELAVNRGLIPVRLPVEVRGEVSGIALRLPPMTTIEGEMTISLRPEHTQLPEAARLAIDLAGGTLGTQMNIAGTFSIGPVAAGPHYMYLILPPTGYVLDVTQGAHDVADDLIVQAGRNAAPLTIVAKPADYGLITGGIRAEIGKTKLSEVLLVPDGPRRANHLQYYWARTRSDGTFKLEYVVPGNYKLFAWEFGRVLELNPYMSPAALASFERYGMPVVMPANGNINVEASLIPR